MKINCVHYISTFLPLTEIWIYNQVKNLNYFKAIIIARHEKNSILFPYDSIFNLRKKGNFFYLLNIGISKLFGFIPFFYSTCKNTNAKILHVHFGYNGIKFLRLKKVLKIPLVCSFYGTDAFKYPFAAKNNAKKLVKLFHNADAILALGPYMTKSLIELGCPSEKIIIHHLGINTQSIYFKERSINKNKPIKFVMASSFVEKKGVDICLNALALLKNKLNFTVDIIGDGILKEEIKALIFKLDLNDKIILHGYKPYGFVLKMAYNSDAFLQASRTSTQNDKEGTPMVFVDVMATGLPVISTKHSDIPEIVEDGETGFLAEENSIDSFAAKIMEFVNNADRIPAISMNCRKKVEQDFCAKRQAFKLENIYARLIKS